MTKHMSFFYVYFKIHSWFVFFGLFAFLCEIWANSQPKWTPGAENPRVVVEWYCYLIIIVVVVRKISGWTVSSWTFSKNRR